MFSMQRSIVLADVLVIHFVQERTFEKPNDAIKFSNCCVMSLTDVMFPSKFPIRMKTLLVT